MSRPEVIGNYESPANYSFSVVEREGRLFLVNPSIPDGYHPELEWIGDSQLRVKSGPVGGSILDLEIEDGVVTGGMVAGSLPINRTDTPPEPIPGEGLLPPEYPDNPERDAVFEELWGSHVSGEAIEVPEPYQVHELVQWLMGRDEFIFHGSKKTDIESFQPRRTSLELSNYAGHGNLGAVYGTHSGLWAMFFAVVDREKMASIRNGFATYVSSETGEEQDLYRFSVSLSSLPDNPFSPGALYVLPRASFERIRFGEEGPFTNEWGSPEPVQPIARFMIRPEDFPFLDRVGGHDDGELIRLQTLTGEVYSSVTEASRIEGGFRLSISEDLSPETLDDWAMLGARFFPDMTMSLVDETTVEILGPDALIHTLEDQFAELLD